MYRLIVCVLFVISAAAHPCCAGTIYVSHHGKDGRSGRTPDEAVFTIEQGVRLTRPGDTILLERGGVYAPIALGNAVDLTFGAYGEGALPVIEGADAIDANQRRTIRNVVFEDLHLRGNGHGSGVSWRARTQGLVLRRCRIENYRMNIVLEGRDNRRIEDVLIEDCVILDAHDPKESGHSHGVYANGVDRLVVRRSFFDNNGRRHDNQGTVFNHALYINVGCGPIIFEDNVCTRNFADGGQFRTGGVIRRNVFAHNPMGVDIGAVLGGSDPIEGGIELTFEDNIIAYPGDISEKHPRGIGMRAGNFRKLQMHRNDFLFCKGGEHGRNVAIMYEKVSDVRITDYAVSDNRVHAFPRMLRDKSDQNFDFGLEQGPALPERDLTPWITEAREKWGRDNYTAAGLRKFILEGE